MLLLMQQVFYPSLDAATDADFNNLKKIVMNIQILTESTWKNFF